MKKTIALILVLVLTLGMTACGGGTQKAFKASKSAYDNIDIAYKITEQYSSDIYEAWRLGIYEHDEFVEDRLKGVEILAKGTSLTKEEINASMENVVCNQLYGKSYEELSDDDKKFADFIFTNPFEAHKNDLFSFCVWIINDAYATNGKVEQAQNALNTAKSQMKEMSEKYSDYEHYPNLKGYYTTTRSFFDFCQTPTGSFEQVKTTINDYKNEARDYISDLDYIFEE